VPKTQIDLSNLQEVTNPAFQPLFTNKDRWLILMGGGGSGKSYFAAEKVLIRILKAAAEGRVHNFLVLRKIKATARTSVFKLFGEYIVDWGLSGKAKINKTDMTITLFPGTKCESSIYCTGLDDMEKIKSIQGITSVWLEEFTEFTEYDFYQLDLRLRGILPDYKQLIASFNPINEQHWIRQNLFGDELQAKIEAGEKIVRRKYTTIVEGEEVSFNMTVMHSTYKDNLFIDKEYKAQLESLVHRDKNFYNIYCLGKWGNLKGLIFDNWSITRDWPDTPEHTGFGLDFGFAIDPSAVVEIAIKGDDLYVREHLYETKLTNPMIAARLAPVAGQELIVADCAEPKSITEIRNTGLMIVPCQKGPDSILHGIQRIRQYNVLLDHNSPNLRKEFASYKWAEKKDGTLLNKPADLFNHLIDATRYILTKLVGGGKVDLEVIGDKENKDNMFTKDGFVDYEPLDANDPAIWTNM
jgi:phage terminase large subunit